MNTIEIKNVMEAALLCSSEPLSMIQLRRLFDDEFNAELLRPLLDEMALDWADRSVELVAVASGWRFQSKPQYAVFINRLSPEKAPKYSRAVMETLAIIAYRQPVTRGDIEEIRGVSVGSQIVKTLEDRGWIDVIGHKEVLGRPALFGTTRQFLDDLNLLSLKELPPIDELVNEESADFFAQADLASVASSEQAETEAHSHSDSAEPLVDDAPGVVDAEDEPVVDLVGEPESDVTGEVLAEPILEAPGEAAEEGQAAAEPDAGHGQALGLAANDQDGAQAPSAMLEQTEQTEELPAQAGHPGSSELDLLAVATAEAVQALADAGETAPAEQVPQSLEVTSSTAKVDTAKLPGTTIDDPNLEQVDWPDLPSLDGLDESSQASSEPTSEQDSPGEESEPVESR